MTLHVVLPVATVAVCAYLVLAWLQRIADQHSWDADEMAEAAAKARAGMPLGHPEMLTVCLSPTDEWFLAELDEELEPEAAG